MQLHFTHPLKIEARKAAKLAHVVAHLCYFGFVSIEAHGHYGIAAGVLFFLTLGDALHGAAD